jgi:biopolymer transport protein ExbD
MGMSVGASGGKKGRPAVMGEMNTTPLIDVMLVLLVMLIITIPIQLAPPSTEKPEVVEIAVDFDGTVLWNGEPLASHAELEARMKEKAALAVQPEVHLRPNKLARYDRVAAVMASAQRIGLKKLGMVGNEQFIK